jgi:formyltetrahydrofolate deformylase
MTAATAILQMICPDQPGLVRELSGWVAGNGGNIERRPPSAPVPQPA